MCNAQLDIEPEEKVTDVIGTGAVATIHLRWEAVPAMKELCMQADRSSAIAEVKDLAWEIFEALDALTNKDYEV